MNSNNVFIVYVFSYAQSQHQNMMTEHLNVRVVHRVGSSNLGCLDACDDHWFRLSGSIILCVWVVSHVARSVAWVEAAEVNAHSDLEEEKDGASDKDPCNTADSCNRVCAEAVEEGGNDGVNLLAADSALDAIESRSHL